MKKQYPNYIRDKKNKLRNKQNGHEETLKNAAKNKEQREEKYGKYSELIKLGETERLQGNPPRIFEAAEMRISYEYGFFVRGSRVLAGTFENGMVSKEEQRYYGIIDFKNGVKENQLLTLKDYPYYIDGRVYQMGREIYNYITENNLTIEEYINLMSIINPYLLNPEFKSGYYDKKNEIEKQGQKRR